MTKDKPAWTEVLTERIASALEPMCRGFGRGNMPMAVARDFAKVAVEASAAPTMAEALRKIARLKTVAEMDEEHVFIEDMEAAWNKIVLGARAALAAARGEG